MPITFRPAAERGHLVDPGLTGTAAFSHGSAFDRDWLGFGALRVLNRVELAAGVRLPAARRANMEVLSLVLSGTYRSTSQAGDSGPVAAGQWHRLERRGVVFEDYDLPDLRTVDHVCVMGAEKAAWFKDPDSNMLCLHQEG